MNTNDLENLREIEVRLTNEVEARDAKARQQKFARKQNRREMDQVRKDCGLRRNRDGSWE